MNITEQDLPKMMRSRKYMPFHNSEAGVGNLEMKTLTYLWAVMMVRRYVHFLIHLF